MSETDLHAPERTKVFIANGIHLRRPRRLLSAEEGRRIMEIMTAPPTAPTPEMIEQGKRYRVLVKR